MHDKHDEYVYVLNSVLFESSMKWLKSIIDLMRFSIVCIMFLTQCTKSKHNYGISSIFAFLLSISFFFFLD